MARGECQSTTSRPRCGEREGPIAKQWEGEGHPCDLFSAPACECDPFRGWWTASRLTLWATKSPGAPHPPNAGASGPSLSPLARGEVYAREMV